MQVAALGILELIVEMQEFRTHHCLALRTSQEHAELRLSTIDHQFLIHFPLTPSNNTKFPLVDEAGQRTSQAPSPSLPSQTSKQ